MERGINYVRSTCVSYADCRSIRCIDLTLYTYGIEDRVLTRALSFFFFFAKNTASIMEGVIKMILFTILLITLIAIAIITLVSAIIAGGSLIVVFGDVIVFALLVWLIVKIFRRKKK